MRSQLSEVEKLAREISPVDSGAIYVNLNEKTLDERIEDHQREKWNDAVEKIQTKFADHEQKLQEAADEYAKNLNGVQIAPIGNYVIVRPFKENPFQKVQVSPSGLIISTGGMTPEYKSNESGEYVEAENPIRVGVVIEVGPECKWLKSGDTIMWTVMSEVCIPFYNFGFKLVNETRALCVINDDLKERFNLSD